MVKIRLKRVGSKKKPQYRVVVADSRAPRDGAVIETIGQYNPLTDPATFVINEEKALKWLRHGAQPTETVASFMRKLGIMEKFKPAAIAGNEQTPAPDTSQNGDQTEAEHQ